MTENETPTEGPEITDDGDQDVNPVNMDHMVGDDATTEAQDEGNPDGEPDSDDGNGEGDQGE